MDKVAFLDFVIEVVRRIDGESASIPCRAARSWNGPSVGSRDGNGWYVTTSNGSMSPKP